MNNKVNDELNKKLYDFFGFAEFKVGQKETLINLLQNKSTLAILPTGTGKSLCYQFFGMYSHQRVLIISPLISLMQDQVEQMKYLGITNVVALTSRLTRPERSRILRNLRSFQFIFASPEILNNSYILTQIKNIGIRLLVIDEAHCIVEWGPDFRPDYLKLGEIRKALNMPLVLALTATATPKIEQEIRQHLYFEKDDVTIRYSLDRPNIYLATEILANREEKNNRLLELIAQIKGPGLVYFSSKKVADEIAEMITNKTNLRAAAYHADLNVEDRFSIQHQFINDQLDLICATSAFGMGVNKKNIRYVIHYHLPGDLENYVQEIGRAGRDGKQSIAILLYADGDEELQYQIQLGSIPNNQEIKYYSDNPQLLEDFKNDRLSILKSFFNMKISNESLISFFNERRSEKNKALNRMLQYVHTTECKRKFILQYFQDEKKIIHNDKCCQSQGIYPLDELQLKKENSKKNNVKKLLTSNQILEKLFNVDED